ncbi:hypothetical protein BCR39DRAFT_471642 [Naematelia encephala]|uniref:Nudix hydrolase domain-containing protein n=1 Tax=Naematelia encephala TaxID=71784 RepID=A0A1Y2ARH8_9TREE|nr:hypothetical protein BCR39DRAFT_471642 [Naematelia encephala]
MLTRADIPPPSSATGVLCLLQSLRHTPPRCIVSPATQPRRASVALIIRMKPGPELAFEGHEPPGWTGEVIPEADFGLGLGMDDFFRLAWVNHPSTVPELLFIRRSPGQSTSNASQSRWSSHIAFPGGRQEPTDESPLYTAFRETWEEIGVDLAEKEFLQVGRLDEREITTSLGKRLLMILSPFVFLQTSPFSPPPELQPTEVSSVHWIPLSSLAPPFEPEQWSQIEIDISTRLSPRNSFIRWALRGLVGKMQFGCVLLPDEPDHVAEGFNLDMEFEEPAEGGSGSWYDKKAGRRMLRLWGLSLGMTLDLLAHLPGDRSAPLILSISRPGSKSNSPDRLRSNSLGPRTPVTVTSSFDDQWETARRAIDASKEQIPMKDELPPINTMDMKGPRGRRRRGVGTEMKAVFPRFSYWDVNFWIWVFGRRYRQVMKGWEASTHGPDRAAARRTNWSGAAMSTFYSAVRQALVVAIVIRGIAVGLGIGGASWAVLRYIASTGREL